MDKLTIRYDGTLGWVVSRIHDKTGLPQVVVYDKDKDVAIARARAAMASA